MAVEVEAGAYMNYARGVFSYNPLHDLESVWWVGVWFLLCHYEPSNLLNIKVQQHMKVVKDYSENLFNNRIDPLDRRKALTSSTLLGSIHPRSFSWAVKELTALLDVFRDELVTYYEIYKPMVSQDRSFFIPDLHRKFGDVVETAMKVLENDNTELWLFHHILKHTDYLNSKR